jgi:phenylpyruvate tautomerase PptA (4-oxalocrotonate tautomerase family)
MPFIAFTVTIPRRDAPAEPDVIEAVTEEVVETANELASWKATTGCVVNTIPLTAPAAFVVLTIFVAAAAPRVIVWVATVNPDAVKVIV